ETQSPKRIKHNVGINKTLRHLGQRRNIDDDSSSSAQGKRGSLQHSCSSRKELAKFMGIKKICIKYANMSWMVKQGFKFPLELEVQGVNTFLVLNGNIYPTLVREFYANFKHKDGMLIIMNEELFMEVGGLASDGSPLCDCNNEQWCAYDSMMMYKSCIREPYYSVQGELTKPAEILKVMSVITSSSSRLLVDVIFISLVIKHVGIDRCNEEVIYVHPRGHLIDNSLIHKMDIYKYGGVWMYQEDYQTTIDIYDKQDYTIQVDHLLVWLTWMPWNNA
ncbi:hypothetical protein Lal_00031401, partial [Lupinus albus]